MKIKLFFTFYIIASMILAISISAQDTGNESTTREESIEELFLRNPALHIVKEEATSYDRDIKLLAITTIEEMLKDGVNAQDEVQIAIILGHLAAEGTTTIIRENGRIINYFPEVRGQACRVLQFVQSSEAREKAVNILIAVLQKDVDPIVKSNAVYTLGILGINDENRVVKAISISFNSQDLIAPNNNFAFAVALAFEKIAKTNSGIFTPEAFSTLVKIIQGNYNKPVRDKAYEVLQALQQYRQ